MAHKKSIFQQFVEANQALIECYNEVDQEPFKGDSSKAASNVCVSQKCKVQDILRSNELNMTRVLTERIAILREMEKNPRRITFDDKVRYLK